jgi:hypothetical protein
MWSFLAKPWIPPPETVAHALPALHPTNPRSIAEWGQSLKLGVAQSLRLAAWLIKIGLARTQPPSLKSSQRRIHLVCEPTDLTSRPDLQRLLTDERWIWHPIEPTQSNKSLLKTLQTVAQQGGHALLIQSQVHVQDHWLAERLHDAWQQLALVSNLPHALAIRHDFLCLVSQGIDQTDCTLNEQPQSNPSGDLFTWAANLQTLADAHGLVVGPWNMAIGQPVKSAAPQLAKASNAKGQKAASALAQSKLSPPPKGGPR